MDQHKGNSKHSKKNLQYKVECLEILGDAFGSNIAISVFSLLVWILWCDFENYIIVLNLGLNIILW